MRTDRKKPIDVVVTYVDGSDPVWREQYGNAGFDVSESSGARFRSNDQFVFFFRSLARYATFVNRVFLVVSTESQVPGWLDREKVTVITHDRIIPGELLPTFNSCTIEMFIHGIPGLSEQFIYCNDDCFFLAPTSEFDFFRNGKACIKLNLRKLSDATTMFRRQCLNVLDLVGRYDVYPSPPKGKYYAPFHVASPMLRSVSQEVFERNKERILDSCTRRRNDKNLNQYIYTESLVFNGLSNNTMPSHKYLDYTKRKRNADEICRFIQNGEVKLLCVNDNSGTPQGVREKILDSFSRRFPNQCKYEIKPKRETRVAPSAVKVPDDRRKDDDAVLASRFFSQ